MFSFSSSPAETAAMAAAKAATQAADLVAQMRAKADGASGGHAKANNAANMRAHAASMARMVHRSSPPVAPAPAATASATASTSASPPPASSSPPAAPSASSAARPNAPSENAPSEKAAGKRPEAAAPATEPSLKDHLNKITHDELREIVRLLATPGSKHAQYYAGGVHLSPILRKLYAQYSFGLNNHGVERGLKPTVREVRAAVEGLGGRWPWADKVQGSDVQVLRSARKTLKAGDFNDIDCTNVGPQIKPAMRVGAPPGPRPTHEELEARLDEWITTECDGKQVPRLAVLRKAVEMDPQFEGHHKLPQAEGKKPTAAAKRTIEEAYNAWVTKASSWYYRFKVRRGFSDVSIASSGPRGPADGDVEAQSVAFGERVLAARNCGDGTLVPPENMCAFDQTPITREIVGRKSLRKIGSKKRLKIRTAGKEKERWTFTPLLFADGRWRMVRGISTFHGAPAPARNATGKGGRRKKLGVRTIAHELHNWKANGYPAGFVFTCNSALAPLNSSALNGAACD